MHRLALVALALSLSACAPPAPPAPPPFAGAPPGPPSELGVRAAPRAEASSGSATPDAGAASAVAKATGEGAEAGAPETPSSDGAAAKTDLDAKPEAPLVFVEPAMKLDPAPWPKTKEAYKAWVADRRLWNPGGLGDLAADPPDDGTHPMPRVVLTVVKVAGPHRAADLQRLLRRNDWIEVIRCYGLGAWLDQTLHGETRIEARVSAAGAIERPRVVKTELASDEVAACLAQSLKKHRMPRAKARSQMTLTIHVSPGDEPMPPPADRATPGDGTIDLEEARRVVAAEVPRFEACYERALMYAPALWGRLVVRYHLTKTGKLDEAFETESHFPDERVARCVLHRARALRFPKPAGGDVRFVVPLRFWSPRAPVPRPTAVP